jgi:hypothetical protein
MSGPRLDRPINIQYNTILKLGGPVKNQFLPMNAAQDASNMPLFWIDDARGLHGIALVLVLGR